MKGVSEFRLNNYRLASYQGIPVRQGQLLR